ncbi:iron chaperone [Pedobacter sp. MW01-1-1]|uniref:iron chaperone n=1 Tax=Pedobacter sp. MW01-1-1 TaxID=3383027 RepID=UPI003FEE6A3F
METKQAFKSVDEYIETFPVQVQLILQEIRKAIKNAAPEAAESISYGMPAYKTHGKALVYFAGYKKHIGFYATPTGHQEFAQELSHYKQGKGSVQFPLNQAMPFELIKQIVHFRARENESKYASK